MHISKNNFSLLFCNGVIAQQHWDIEGRFPQAANQEILLKGFNMQGDSPLSTTTSDERVRFTCSTRHVYVAATRDKEQQEFIVLLKDENFSMQWDSLEDSPA
jgi:hypothetical protein